MAEMKFSPDQQEIIRHRNGSLLVSAAAGSGKTTTMVGHVVDRIRDPQHPGDLGRMLIVTFTRAAAAEMRQRITDRLSEALESEPDNAHLRHQLALAGQAMIGTIDSYCSYLVRNHFHRADIAPDLRLADKPEMDLLQDQLLDQLLEEAYLEGRESFFRLLSAYSSEKNHGNIKRMIRDLYQSAQNAPFPEKWLQDCLGEMPADTEAFFRTDWMLAWYRNLRRTAEEARDSALLLRDVFAAESDSKEYSIAAGDIVQMEHILRAENAEEMIRRIRSASFSSNSGLRPENKLLFDSFRSTVRGSSGYLSRICKPAWDFRGAEEERKLYLLTAEPRQELVRLTLRFSEALREACRDKNITDFNGMEHLALNLLIRAGENGLTERTDLAEDIRKDLDEVIVDEYQDINQIQENILWALGEGKLFMVGDIKQSIYRFRRARPDIFSAKYERFSDAADAPERRIDLKENYRSRSEILEGANDFFRAVMSPEVGGVCYDEKASLVPKARNYQGPGALPELWLVNTDQNAAERAVLESRLIAREIRNLANGGLQVSDPAGGVRDVRWSDIVILLRSPKNYAPVVAGELKRFGIPTLYDHKTGFYDTREIQTLLSVLKVIDNPRQDIPLAGVLLSPFGGWSEAELAGLEAAEGKDGAELWDLLKEASSENPKAAEFLEKLEGWRELAGHQPLPELLRRLMRESGYEYYLQAAPDGRSRMANAKELIALAEQYENSSYRGLYQFLRFIDQQKKLETEDRGEAQVPDGSEEAVRILSIHASKGLEYPIVFVARLEGRFDERDAQGDYFTDESWGIALKSVDTGNYVHTDNLFYLSAKEKVIRESRSEELRLLYVAMTRAKERLYLVGAMKNAEEGTEKYLLPAERDKLPPSVTREATSYQTWLTAAAVNGLLPHIRLQTVSEEDIPTPEKAAINEARTLLERQADADEKELKRLREEMAFAYPYGGTAPLKLAYSVSELKKNAASAQPETADLSEEALGFSRELKTLSGADRGTAYHKLMEYLPFEKVPDAAAVEACLRQAAQEGYFTEEEVRSISPQTVAAFFEQPVGQRAVAAATAKKLWREQPFVRGLPYRAIDPESDREETVLLQGIIDLYFEENGKLILIDYKTDRVRDEAELAERYRLQLEYYSEALSAARAMPVTEVYLYSFTLNRFIPLVSNGRLDKTDEG